jgi:hypothetical protein
VRALPSPSGDVLDLRANAAGDLYVRTATNVLWLSLRNPESGWKPLALEGVVDLSENTGKEVFARRDLKTRFSFYRLSGGEAVQVASAPHEPCNTWYVDATGRLWFQTPERILVVGKDETLIERPMGRPTYGLMFRQPCEWRPGHVALFYASEAVWATPDAVTVRQAPPFAADGTGKGPYRLGLDRLVGGGSNNDGAGTYFLDPKDPEKAPERARLGWDWFHGVATAPDGRLLVLAQTDRNPQFTLFWYAADGRSEVRLEGAENVIRMSQDHRALTGTRIVFALTTVSGGLLPGLLPEEVALLTPSKGLPPRVETNAVGYAAVGNGTVAVFLPDEAVLLTPAKGLPLPRVEHLAAVGEDLVMAGDGKIVVWRTSQPLKPGAGLDERREWQLAGPCARDSNGRMWAFLLDAPGKISRHDGRNWDHFEIALGNRIPTDMTADDLGRLQIGFMDAPSGSLLVAGGDVTHWPSEPIRAWSESITMGASRFSDGSPFRPRHVAAGKGVGVWLYDGRTFNDGRRGYDYCDTPPYNHFWIGPGGVCYRGGAGRLYAYAAGRWTETETPPLSAGPDGIRAEPPAADRRPVVYDGRLKLPMPDTLAKGAARFLALNGNEAFVPAADGGGWVGGYRVFRNAYYPLAGRVYPGTNGHYLVSEKTLRFQPPHALKLEGEVLADGNQRRLACRITGVEPLCKPRLLVFIDGDFQKTLTAPDGGNLPPLPPGPHSVEVYAGDGFGTISAQPLKFTVDCGPEFPVTKLDLGEEWTIKPRRLQTMPPIPADRTGRGYAMEIDADGVVWIFVEGGVVAVSPVERQATFHQCPVRELLSARGRVWAQAGWTQDGLRIVILELRRDGVRRAMELYDDSSYGSRQISADGAGGIWALSQHAAVRWDGTEVRTWNRPLGNTAFVVPTAESAIISTSDHYMVYRNGELSQPVAWPGDLKARRQQPDRTAYSLGRKHLVLPFQRLLLDLDSGRPSDGSIPFGDTYRQGSDGSLYVWKAREFYRISGDDLAVTRLAYSSPPSMPPLFDAGGYEFLAASNGVVAYSAGNESLFLGRAEEGAVEYGWRQGVQPGCTRAIRAAPDGRIWILRASQLLVFDPAQPADTAPSAWPDWREERFFQRLALGAFGRVWYMNPDRSSLPVAYRMDGVKAVPLGQAGKCLIDAHGLRWYDAGLVEANPGCMPVWYASRDKPEVSGGANVARSGIDSYASLQAFPLRDGRFLLRVGAKLHVLDAQGLKRIPGGAVPCGDELDPSWGLRVWPLAGGRWAMVVQSRIYVSPPDLRFDPTP